MVEEVEKQVKNLIETAGKAFLAIKFPRDFEVYFCSLELCSFEGEMIDYLSFPIMPNSITKKEPYIANIKKTFGGVTVIRNDDFIPQEIILRGNFGRTFKILGGKELINVFGISKFSDGGEYRKGTLNNVIKTGYGVTKYLQGIIERSKLFDGSNKQPRMLILHNYTLGESYLVEPSQVQFEQNLASNMIWNYTLNFNVIRCIDYGRSGGVISFASGKTLDTRKRLVVSATQSVVSSIGTAAMNYGANKLRGLV